MISGAKRPTGDVLVYDDHGANQALDAVERLITAAARPHLVTPERTVSPDLGSLTAAGYFANLAQNAVPITVMRRLVAIERTGSQCTVTLGLDGSEHREFLIVDAVVAEMGPRRSPAATCMRPCWMLPVAAAPSDLTLAKPFRP